MKYLFVLFILIHCAFSASIPMNQLNNEEVQVLDVVSQDEVVNAEVKKDDVQVVVEESAPIEKESVQVIVEEVPIAGRNVEPLEVVQDSALNIVQENEIPLVQGVPLKEKLIEIEEKSVGSNVQEYVEAIKLVSTEDKVEGVNNVVANVKETLKKVEPLVEIQESAPIEALVKEAKSEDMPIMPEMPELHEMPGQKEETPMQENSETSDMNMDRKVEEIVEVIPEQEISKRIDEDVNALELIDSKPNQTEIKEFVEPKIDEELPAMSKSEEPVVVEKIEEEMTLVEEPTKEEKVKAEPAVEPVVEKKIIEVEETVVAENIEAKSEDMPLTVEVKENKIKLDLPKIVDDKEIVLPKSDDMPMPETVKEKKPMEEEKLMTEIKQVEAEKPIESEKPIEETKSLSEEQLLPEMVKEEKPILEEKPIIEEKLVTEEKPVKEEKSMAEEKPLAEEKPMTEEMPKLEEKPMEEIKSVVEKKPVVEEKLLIEEKPIVEEFKPIEAKKIDELELHKKEEPLPAVTPIEQPKAEIPNELISENNIEISETRKEEPKPEESMPMLEEKPAEMEKIPEEKVAEPLNKDSAMKETVGDMLRDAETDEKQSNSTQSPGPVASFIQNALQTVGLAPAQDTANASESSDSTTSRPNIIQQIQTNFQNFIGGNQAQAATAPEEEIAAIDSASTTARPGIIAQITNAVNSTLNRPADAQQGPLATFVSNLLGTPSSTAAASAAEPQPTTTAP